jgi:hypothetical protein
VAALLPNAVTGASDNVVKPSIVSPYTGLVGQSSSFKLGQFACVVMSRKA